MHKWITKWKSTPDSVKSSVAFVFSSFLLKGISFITTPIFTRLMDTTQYGIMTVYSSWMSIIDVIALLGLTSAGVINVGLSEYSEERDKYISSILGLCNAVTIVVFAMIFCFKDFFSSWFGLQDDLLLLMLIHFIFSPAQIFWITRQKYEYKYRLATLITVASTLLAQACAIFAVTQADANAASVRLWTVELVTLMFYVPLFLSIYIRGKNPVNLSIWKHVLCFAIPLLPHYLAQHVMSASDRIMIADLISEADAAIYSVVANISMVATIIWTAISGSLIPYTFENLKKKNYHGINKVSIALIAGYGVMCFGVCLIAPEILHILAPPEYHKGIYAVPPIAGVAFLSAMYNVFANIEFFHKKAKYIARATIVATVVNIILNYILIKKFTFIGASYATLISYVVLIVMHYLGYRQSSSDKVYDGKSFLLLGTGIIALCLVCNLFYVHATMKYVIIVLLVLMLILKREMLIQMLKKMKG